MTRLPLASIFPHRRSICIMVLLAIFVALPSASATRRKKPNPEPLIFTTQVCAAELAAAKFLAFEKAESESSICHQKRTHLIEPSVRCSLNAMRRCRYQGWECTIQYYCTGTGMTSRFPQKIQLRSPTPATPPPLRSIARIPDRLGAGAKTNCDLLDRRLRGCLPFNCKNTARLWNIELKTHYTVHGRPNPELCLYSQIQMNEKVYSIRECRIPQEKVGEFAEFLSKTVSQEKRHKITHKLEHSRVLAVIDGEVAHDPSEDENICTRYYYYLDQQTCHQGLQGDSGLQKRVDCAWLQQRFPVIIPPVSQEISEPPRPAL